MVKFMENQMLLLLEAFSDDNLLMWLALCAMTGLLLNLIFRAISNDARR